MTDTEIVELIEQLGSVTVEENNPASSQHEGTVCIFTVVSQKQYGNSVRELFEIVAAFVRGERCWFCENWDFHKRHSTQCNLR